MAKRESTISTFKILWPFIRKYQIGIWGGILGMIINSIISTGLIYLLKPLLDKGLGDADHSFLRILALIIVILFIFRGVTGYAGKYCLAWVAGKVVMDLRRKLFSHIMRMPVAFFDKNSSGELLSKITYDSEQVAASCSDSLIVLVRDSCSIIGLLALMIYTSWKLSFIILIIAPILLFIIAFVSKKSRKLSHKMQDNMGSIASRTEQMLQGHKVVISYNGQGLEEQRFNIASNDMRRSNMRMINLSGISEVVVQVVASLALATILILASFPGIIGKELTVGSFSLIFTSIFSLLQPLRSISRVNSNFQRGMAACISLFEILESEQEIDKGTYSVDRAKGEIIFNQVSFQYPTKATPALISINCKIPPGKTVALVGKSGSGKSTIASLLMRFYPVTSGSITLDGIDINQYIMHNLRKQIALVSQQVYLFNESIANNIAYAAEEECSREQIEHAAKLAYVTDFTDHFPEKLDTIIGENGVTLSGGQRQRIAIARAILRNSPILILDEATSALDNESEHMIQKALKTLQQDRTCLIIAHRLSTIENADTILVMENGNIVESGNHQELLAKEGTYAQLYNMQFEL